MSNVNINVDRRTDGQKIGRLYRTLLQAGTIIMFKLNSMYWQKLVQKLGFLYLSVEVSWIVFINKNMKQ